MDEQAQTYLESKKYIGEALTAGGVQFSKTLITLSAGAFGLSLVIVKDFNTQVKSHAYALVLAWSLLLASVAALLISMLLSMKAFAEYDRFIDDRERDQYTPPKTFNPRWNRWVFRLNCVAAAAFVLGAAFLAVATYCVL